MTRAEKNAFLARELFINGNSEAKIAELLDVSVRTIQNYKSKDETNGISWLELKAQKYINTPLDSSEDKETIYSNFTKFMYESLQEIRDDEKLSAGDKTALMAQLGDSFSKMQKVARTEDPEAYKLGIIQNTLEIIAKNLKGKLSEECLEIVVNTIVDSEEEIVSVTI